MGHLSISPVPGLHTQDLKKAKAKEPPISPSLCPYLVRFLATAPNPTPGRGVIFENSYKLDKTPLHAALDKPVLVSYQYKGFLIPNRAADKASG